MTPEKMPKAEVPEHMPSGEVKLKEYKVFEVVSKEHKESAWKLHSQKVAFKNEHDHVKARIFDNEEVQCRSWLLEELDAVPQPSHSSEPFKPVYLAAVTVRLNPYMQKAGLAWAQVMNLSVSRERQGHGTRLYSGVEELLQREGVDVVALYPVQNSRATNFWASMGFFEQPGSLLPAEELDTRNGALLPEGCKVNGEKVMLPRWEKKLQPSTSHPVLFEARWQMELEGGTLHTIDTQNETTWKPLKREQWPLWRRTAAKLCKLDIDEVARRFDTAQKDKRWLRTL